MMFTLWNQRAPAMLCLLLKWFSVKIPMNNKVYFKKTKTNKITQCPKM